MWVMWAIPIVVGVGVGISAGVLMALAEPELKFNVVGRVIVGGFAGCLVAIGLSKLGVPDFTPSVVADSVVGCGALSIVSALGASYLIDILKARGGSLF